MDYCKITAQVKMSIIGSRVMYDILKRRNIVFIEIQL